MTDDTSEKQGNRKKVEAPDTGQVLLRILEGQGAHGRLLQTILQLLTASRDGDGPSLTALIESLIKRIGDQTLALQALAAAVAKLGRELPGDLVAAIEDNLERGEHDANGTSGRAIPS